MTLAKAKRRYLRYRRRQEHKRNIAASMDTHHLCYQKRAWKGAAGDLRRYWYCRVDIQKNTLHREIHSLIDTIPVPRAFVAKEVLEDLRALERYGAIKDNDPIELRLKVLIALFDCIEQPTADAFRKQLQIVYEFKKSPR